MAVSDSSSQSVLKSTDIMIERLDKPHQKVRVQRQLDCLRKLSYSGIVCLLINTVYFAYRVKCSLDGHSYLSTLNLMIIWTFLGLEFSLACRLHCPTYINEREIDVKSSARLLILFASCIVFEKTENKAYVPLGWW